MEQLASFKPWRQWVTDGDGGPAFTTLGGMEWFLRHYKHRLAKEGHLLLRSGPGGHLVGPGFGDAVLQILREESSKKVA